MTYEDDELHRFLERSVRDRVADAAEQLLRHGCLGTLGAGIDRFRDAAPGREREDAVLSTHTPIVKLPFKDPDAPPLRTDRVWYGTRAIFDSSADPSTLDPLQLPLLTIAVTKKSYCDEVTVSLALGGSMCLLVLRDKLTPEPLGIYTEVRELGDCKLGVLVLDDPAPRSFRLAVVDLDTDWSFQLVALDNEDPAVTPFLDPSRPRGAVLSAVLELNDRTDHEPVEKPSIELPKTKVLGRWCETADNRPVLLSVVREVAVDRSVRIPVFLYNPVTAGEVSLLLAGSALDRILTQAGLPDHRSVTADEVDNHATLVDLIRRCVHVTPEATLQFQMVQQVEGEEREEEKVEEWEPPAPEMLQVEGAPVETAALLQQGH